MRNYPTASVLLLPRHTLGPVEGTEFCRVAGLLLVTQGVPNYPRSTREAYPYTLIGVFSNPNTSRPDNSPGLILVPHQYWLRGTTIFPCGAAFLYSGLLHWGRGACVCVITTQVIGNPRSPGERN